MKKYIPIVSLFLVIAFAFSGCETPGQSALTGAAAGAAIGGSLRGRGYDALHGAMIGAGTGYLLGKIAQDQRRDAYDRGYYDARGYDDRDGYYRERPRYPYGTFTNRDGFVRSPYRPYHIIDVRGIPSGSRVVDPSCDRIFINP